MPRKPRVRAPVGGFKTLSRRKASQAAAKTSQQAKFKAAAKKCKGSPNYRACMKRELRKK